MKTIDAIGCITYIGQIAAVTVRQTQSQKDRRNVVLADESGLCVTVSLWGKNASREELSEGQVMAVKGARVSNYNGCSLNAGDEHSQIFINCDHPRSLELQKWWKVQDQQGPTNF